MKAIGIIAKHFARKCRERRYDSGYMLRLFCAALLSFAAFAQTLPRPATDIPILLPDGKQIKLTAYRGHPVILAFILTTCSHCQNTTRILSGVQSEYAAKGLKVVEAAINDLQSVPGFVRNFNPPFPVGYADHNTAVQYLQLSPMVRSFVPFLLFIDRKGMIRAQYTGSDPYFQNEEKNARAEVEKLLAPEPAAEHARSRKHKS